MLLVTMCGRFSTAFILGAMKDAKKYKFGGVTLNPLQKPLLLFIKHLSQWSQPGELVVDATCGSGTAAVGPLL